MRKTVIAGNWKMNKTQAETKAFFNELLPLVNSTKNTVIICAPYTDLAVAVEATKGTNVAIGAQNVHFKNSGAYTGEITPAMLTEIGVTYCIIGHSERRQYFGETDQTVNARMLNALEGGLIPILCIGENLEERQNDKVEEVLSRQIDIGFANVTEQQLAKVIVAYEPVWAIGTGVTATSQQAQDTISFIRKHFAKLYGNNAAEQLIIQYGGSMNGDNAAQLLSQPDIDGGLIGGASLVPSKFEKIVNAK